MNELIYFITFATHNSRIGQRMLHYNIFPKNPVIFDTEQEIIITELLFEIVKDYKYKIVEYNICKDHIHLIIVCNKDKRDGIIKIIKSKLTLLFKKKFGITDVLHLWTQKYYWRVITSLEELNNVINYIQTNRKKHDLQENENLKNTITKIKQSITDNIVEWNNEHQFIVNDNKQSTADNIVQYNNEHQFIVNDNKQSTDDNIVQYNNEHQFIVNDNKENK